MPVGVGAFARLLRRLHVFFTASVVFVALKVAQRLLAWTDPSPARYRLAWSRVHTWCAYRLLGLALKRRGFWVKCCQYVASRGDVLPPEYPAVLNACLDACPADDAEVIRAAVEGELGGRAIEDVFDHFDAARPIASASIAQVHFARLRETGRDVVLKVQHPGVRKFLMQDLRDLSDILNWVSMFEPEFDLRPMMEAWIEMVPYETDFRNEIENVKRVRELFEKAPEILRTRARVPEPIEEMSTETLFVMEYVDGCRIADLAGAGHEQVDRERLVTEITKSFALQLHISGNFNGDPHPGNFLVDESVPGALPVLLDFGISVPLDMETKLGFSRLVLAAVENDSYSLLQSFSDMGIHLNRADPVASMELIKFMFRTTVPQEQTVEESHAFKKRMLQHREKSKVENVEVKSGKIPPGGDDSVYKRPLIDAYPGHLVFFMRSLALLRGLATTLGVRHAYLPVLQKYATEALFDACPKDQRAKELIYRVPVADRESLPRSLSYWRSQRVQSRLEKVLKLLDDHGLFIGCQVAVYHKGELIVDTAAGRRGKHNPRPVQSDAVFNGFNVSEALVSVLFAQMQDEYLVDKTDLLGIRWPQFAVNGKEKTTVQHLLSHTTGIPAFAAKNLTLARLHDDRNGILGDLLRAEPVHKPGKHHEHRFYDLNFGYLAAGMIEHVTGESYINRFEHLTKKLDIADECFCGNLPPSLQADSPTNRVASLSNSILEDLEQGAQDHAGSGEPHASGDDNMGKLYSGDDTMDKAKTAFETILSHQGAPAAGGAAGIDANLLENLPMYFLEPAFFNHPFMRSACVPSANAHFSARALAKVFAVLANDGVVGGKRVLRRGRVREMMRPHFDSRADSPPSSSDRLSPAAHGVAYGAGLPLHDTVKDGHLRRRSAIGCIGIGGTTAFAIPRERFAIAVTVNKLNFVSAASAAIVILVCKSLGMPIPVEFARMEMMAKKIREENRRNGVEADLFQSMKDALAANVASVGGT